jgi:hypothetical protein
LRNRIKTLDHVKGLKFDYGFGGFGGGGPPGSSGNSLFGSAFGGQYQSITQKILRKNLGNGARKMLDSANERLTKILNTGQAYKIKTKMKKKAAKKLKDGYGDEMEDLEKDKEGHSDEDISKSDGEHNEDSGSSDGYGDMENEEDEREMEADIERQRLLDLFVEELPDEILASNIPEDQKTMLVKILTRQHAFMID